ncbi:DUF3465 domain-containing protein [Methylobacillus caricis]|uniref:DUF3465 domain-containing protein n=1 Tax=Methylobacillus caricis TaxID=1971611 RepID=UPI001CFFF84D|nr:DUF3465 domain-containing protein [Methylobacillus caricis]MCB5188766.1 DUF3465 domain-containing protein [Methylobacillus caricis]
MIRLFLVIAIALVYTGYHFSTQQESEAALPGSEHVIVLKQPSAADARIQQAFDQHENGVQVQSRGLVAKVLPDDEQGARHQRFILKLNNDMTLLVAHNIDLAPRISGLKVGDEVDFYGVYEWGHKGGVIHWTHHDPQGRHTGGWLRHNERVYQ